MNTSFWLMRHAATAWNAAKRLQGQRNTLLSPEGEAQAQSWAGCLASLGIERILCSDLTRAAATAEIVNASLGVKLLYDSRLREQDWGDWVGKSLKQLRKKQPEDFAACLAGGWDYAPKGGESRLAVYVRAREALLDAGARWPGQRMLVVTHLGVIKSLVYRLLDQPFAPDQEVSLKRYRLHRITAGQDGLVVRDINQEFPCV